MFDDFDNWGIGTEMRVRFRTGLLFSAACLGLVSSAALVAQEKPSQPAKITFDEHAKPVLMQRCSSCHNGQRKEGDLDVTNYTNLMIGGGSGEVIEPGAADDSYLFRLVTHDDSPEMPPGGNKIPDPQIEILRKWIDGGALENSGSVVKKRKPKKDYSTVATGDTKPAVEPVPSRLPLIPQHVAARTSTVHSLATNPWSKYVAVSSPRQVLVYRTSDLGFRGVIPFPEGQPESLRFSRNGSLLLIAGGKPGASGKVVVWDAIKGRRVAVVGDETDSVLAADIHPSQTFVALGGPQKRVRAIGLDGEMIYELKKHTDWITAMQFSPDGKFLVTGDRNGGIHAWEASTGNEVLTLAGHKKAITAIDYRIDGKLLLTASEDGTLRVWDGNSGKQIKSWTACGSGVTDACFTRDGLVVTGGRDRLARVWDQNGKQLHQYQAMSDQLSSLAYCSETNRVIAGDWAGQIQVWEKANPKPVGALSCNPPTIEARIEYLEKKLAKATEILTPLVQRAVQMDERIAAMKAENDAEASTLGSTETSLNAAIGKLASADRLLKSTVEQQQAWRTELANKEKAAPQLAASLASAMSALESLGDDSDMRETVGKLKTRQAQITARIGKLKSQLNQVSRKQETVKAEIAALKIQRDESRQQVARLNASIAARDLELGKANDVRARHQQALAKAQAEADSRKGSLAYRKRELKFASDLAALENTLKTAEEVDFEKQEEIDAATEKLAAAQAIVHQARQQQAESARQIEAIEQQIQALKGE